MKKIIITSSIIAFSLCNLSTAFAAEVKGDVKTDVKVGAIIQSNVGAGNKNIANLGSVSGKSKVGGDFEAKVKVGAIIQSNVGAGNVNKVNIASVSDD